MHLQNTHQVSRPDNDHELYGFDIGTNRRALFVLKGETYRVNDPDAISNNSSQEALLEEEMDVTPVVINSKRPLSDVHFNFKLTDLIF